MYTRTRILREQRDSRRVRYAMSWKGGEILLRAAGEPWHGSHHHTLVQQDALPAIRRDADLTWLISK